MKFKPDISLFIRFVLIVALAGLALGLISEKYRQPAEKIQSDISTTIKEIDREVDSVLTQFRIEKNWCKKKQFPVPGTNISRTEMRVLIPPDIIPVQVNHALNLMAKRYGGRAIGSENSKDNSVTIHIKLENCIIETIILKTSKDLNYGVEKKQRNFNKS